MFVHEARAEEMRTLGRRRPAEGLAATAALLRLVVDLRAGKPFVPRGLYRFSSFEESEEWTLRMLTRRSTRQSSDDS